MDRTVQEISCIRALGTIIWSICGFILPFILECSMNTVFSCPPPATSSAQEPPHAFSAQTLHRMRPHEPGATGSGERTSKVRKPRVTLSFGSLLWGQVGHGRIIWVLKAEQWAWVAPCTAGHRRLPRARAESYWHYCHVTLISGYQKVLAHADPCKGLRWWTLRFCSDKNGEEGLERRRSG